jgi:uncharacterized RDD family membrane protein YckC
MGRILPLLFVVADGQVPASPGGVRQRLGHLAGSVGNRVLDELDTNAVVQRLDIPEIIERIDVDALVARIDVDALLARIDVDALVSRIDADALMGRIDIDALVGRVDIDALVARVDVDALVARIAVNELLDRVDVDRVLDRVDVGRVLDRVDVNALLARADVDALLRRADIDAVLDRVDVARLVDRIDVDQVVGRIDVAAVVDRVDIEATVDRLDLEALVRRAGIPQLIADSTGQVAGSALDLARRQLVGLDVGVGRVVQRLLRRDPDALPVGPSGLVADGRTHVEAPAPDASRVRARFEVSGFYAGPISRVLAFGGDVALATATFAGAAAILSWLLATLFGVSLPRDGGAGWGWALALAVWQFWYWWLSTALAGRTPVMALAGLRIVTRAGAPIRPRTALVRTLTLPLSLLAFGIGGAWMLVDRERRALHDLLSSTAVVYDWGGRPAEMPTPLSRWLETHGVGDD